MYFLGFGFGVADAFAMPASQAFLPSLVAREDLVAANSLVQSTAQLTTIVGPAPAGLAIKAMGTAWAFGVGLPYLTKTRFDSATAYGIAVSALAAGGLVGARLAGLWRVRHRGRLILILSGILALSLGSVGVLRPFPAIAAALLVMGACAGFANVQIMAWLQQRVDAAVRGRAMSVLMLPGMGLLPVSLAVAGLLAAWSLPMMCAITSAALLGVAMLAAPNRTVRGIR